MKLPGSSPAGLTASSAASASQHNAQLASGKKLPMPMPLQRIQSLSSPSMHTEPALKKNPAHVIRWRGELVADAAETSEFMASQPNSPNISSLREALEETISLPVRPPIARIPPSFRASSRLTRAPPFIDNLTRSTLPLASMSSSGSVSDEDITYGPRSRSTSSPSRQSSTDMLRYLNARSIHTSTGSQQSPTKSPTSNWWWFSENKGHIDTAMFVQLSFAYT